MRPLQITAQAIKDELEARGFSVGVIRTPSGSLLYIDHKGRRRFMRSSSIDSNSVMANVICNDKVIFGKIAKGLDLPVPDTETYETIELAAKFLDRHGVIVIKPAEGAHGNGITTGVDEVLKLAPALATARSAYPASSVIMQQQVSGADYRLLIIGNKLAAAAKRVPASVTGDGTSTVKELILRENAGLKRTVLYSERLCKIDQDEAWTYLGDRQSSVPAKGSQIQVVGTANIGSGGHSDDVTDKIPQRIIDVALGLCRNIGAVVCGVDFMHDEKTDEWHLIEANMSPSFGLHMNPLNGKRSAVDAMFVDELLRT